MGKIYTVDIDYSDTGLYFEDLQKLYEAHLAPLIERGCLFGESWYPTQTLEPFQLGYYCAVNPRTALFKINEIRLQMDDEIIIHQMDIEFLNSDYEKIYESNPDDWRFVPRLLNAEQIKVIPGLVDDSFSNFWITVDITLVKDILQKWGPFLKNFQVPPVQSNIVKIGFKPDSSGNTSILSMDEIQEMIKKTSCENLTTDDANEYTVIINPVGISKDDILNACKSEPICEFIANDRLFGAIDPNLDYISMMDFTTVKPTDAKFSIRKVYEYLGDLYAEIRFIDNDVKMLCSNHLDQFSLRPRMIINTSRTGKRSLYRLITFDLYSVDEKR